MNKFLFPHITRWLWLLIPFTIVGFYPSYFSVLLTDLSLVYHVHAVFMSLWIGMAIVQPYLIKQKNTRLHKLIGRISYFIMPCVFVTTYLVIEQGYNSAIASLTVNVTNGVSGVSLDEIMIKAAAQMRLGIIYLLWLASFYVLAVINKKKTLFHATYMFAAILTLLGPTIDRAVGHACDYLGWPYNFFAENIVFIAIVLLLSGLLYYQWRKGNSIKPASVSLGIYGVGLLIFYTLPGTGTWRSFVELIL